jgi:hypothetical protein
VTDSRRPGTRDRPDTAANPHHENPYSRSSFRSRPQSEGVRWQHRPAAEDEGDRSILTSFWVEYVVQETERVAAGGSPPGPGGVGEPTNRFTLKLGLMHTLFRVIGVLPRSGRERSTRLRLRAMPFGS